MSGDLGVGGDMGGRHASEGFDLKSNRLNAPRAKQPFPLSREAVRGEPGATPGSHNSWRFAPSLNCLQ